MADEPANIDRGEIESPEPPNPPEKYAHYPLDILEMILASGVEFAIGNGLIHPNGVSITLEEIYRSLGFKTRAAERALARCKPQTLKAKAGNFESVLDYINSLDINTSSKPTLRAPSKLSIRVPDGASFSQTQATMSNDSILKDLAKRLRGKLEMRVDGDTIDDCGNAVLSIMSSRPDDGISLANTQLHARPYREVATSWRRAYEEASLWKVLRHIESIVSASTSKGTKRTHDGEPVQALLATSAGDSTQEAEDSKDWLTECVEVIDRALITTGAPGRKEVIEDLLKDLSHCAESLDPADVTIPDQFPTSERSFEINATIPRVDHLTLEAFQQHLDTTASPIIIRDALSSWPAASRWKNPQYLLSKTINGRRLVPVELGKSYTSPLWSQKIMPFSTYMKSHLLSASATTGYLAQHDLLSQIHGLSGDVTTPDYCYSAPPAPDPASAVKQQEELEEPLRNAWLGPAGTISPLHTDPYHNILCQVVGRKGVDERGVSLENTSEVDLEVWRNFEQSKDKDQDNEVLKQERAEFEEKFPLFTEAKFVEAVLKAGECIYIPVGWWHYIESLDVSFNVSYWFN
ncbi:hypothetical protein MBLNU457_4501t1 [Dothideomycetes sp. NU457]